MGSGTLALDDFRGLVGQKVGTSRWFLVDQARIDAFAEVTEDRQFIHVDPEAATRTPFGGTIAHGYLTLSLLSAMAADAVPAIQGATMSLNYGFNSIRFLSPVRVDRKIRARFVLKEMKARDAGNWQSAFEVTVEIEGEDRPALIAEWLTLTSLGKA